MPAWRHYSASRYRYSSHRSMSSSCPATSCPTLLPAVTQLINCSKLNYLCAFYRKRACKIEIRFTSSDLTTKEETKGLAGDLEDATCGRQQACARAMMLCLPLSKCKMLAWLLIALCMHSLPGEGLCWTSSKMPRRSSGMDMHFEGTKSYSQRIYRNLLRNPSSVRTGGHVGERSVWCRTSLVEQLGISRQDRSITTEDRNYSSIPSFKGWVKPGPIPPPHEDLPKEGETLDALCGKILSKEPCTLPQGLDATRSSSVSSDALQYCQGEGDRWMLLAVKMSFSHATR